jgi:hypothetical protein
VRLAIRLVVEVRTSRTENGEEAVKLNSYQDLYNDSDPCTEMLVITIIATVIISLSPSFHEEMQGAHVQSELGSTTERVSDIPVC